MTTGLLAGLEKRWPWVSVRALHICMALLCVLPAAAASGQGSPGTSASAQSSSALGKWGDQHDGTFVNPVLPGDFSDLDAIRVADDFYAISSTMQYSPGMAVLHSRDLVNWEIVGHVVANLTVLDPELGWDRMGRDGRGIWAGSIRFHAGRFWVYFGTPDGGIYVSTAARADGVWSVPRLVLAGGGWDDPCPFWDDDGKGYLVATRFAADADGQKYRIHLFAMTAGSDGVLQESDRVLHQSPGSEANKLYKVGGEYLHYFSEVRPEGRVAMMERSHSLSGPWKVRQLNHVHGTMDKEPNQGGLLQLPNGIQNGLRDEFPDGFQDGFQNGRWWFLTHQGKGDWEGRAGVLLPVTWIDGWPVLGEPGPDGIGNMVWGAAKPISGTQPPRLFASDAFRARTLPPQWEWRYQPRKDAWSLTGHSLRLRAFAPIAARGFGGVGNVLTQRSARTRSAEVTVQMDLRGLRSGQEAGLAHFARTNCRLAIVQEGAERRIVRIEQEARVAGPAVRGNTVWLRSTWGVDGLAQFAYSLDGGRFEEIGGRHRLSWGAYRGDRIGLYTFSNMEQTGYVDFRSFQYRVE